MAAHGALTAAQYVARGLAHCKQHQQWRCGGCAHTDGDRDSLVPQPRACGGWGAQRRAHGLAQAASRDSVYGLSNDGERRGNIGGGGGAQRPQLKPRRSRYGSLVSVASLVAFLKAAAEERYFECRNKRWCRI